MALLQAMGVNISKRQVMRLLIAEQDAFLADPGMTVLYRQRIAAAKEEADGIDREAESLTNRALLSMPVPALSRLPLLSQGLRL
jgi:hypothetical protein